MAEHGEPRYVEPAAPAPRWNGPGGRVDAGRVEPLLPPALDAQAEIARLREELANACALADGALDRQAELEREKWAAEAARDKHAETATKLFRANAELRRERDRYVARCRELERRLMVIRSAADGRA